MSVLSLNVLLVSLARPVAKALMPLQLAGILTRKWSSKKETCLLVNEFHLITINPHVQEDFV